MIEEDVAKDNLRSCSQQTHYLFDWTQSISNPTPPLQNRQAKKTFTRISAQITSDFHALKIKPKRYFNQKEGIAEETKQQMKNKVKQKSNQRKRQVLCRFEYPLIDQSDQTNFWSKMKQDVYSNKKLQSISKHNSRKKLTDLVQQQINKLYFRKAQMKQSNKLSPLAVKQQFGATTNTLPIITKGKIKPFTQQQYESKEKLIDAQERQESTIKRRSSMPIIRPKYKL